MQKVSAPVEVVSKVIIGTGSKMETYVAPVRDSILNKYPTIFALLVTLGATATFLGLEQILLNFAFLKQYPELIFYVGVGILFFTGNLYKKLS